MKSIISEYENICAICGRPAEVTHHLIRGNGLRKLADQDGLTMRLCNSCHNMAGNPLFQIHENPVAEVLSKQLAEIGFEKEYYRKRCPDVGDEDEARNAFRKRYGRSYL